MAISIAQNIDCMIAMAEFPDKYFDLAIVDPPYGIGVDGQSKSTSNHNGRRAHEFKNWDSTCPDENYFNELFRVSKNQIIWGANYMTKYLPASMGWIFWDKGQRINSSDGELAFTSFNRALRVVNINRAYLSHSEKTTIHPTQKPIKLYEWLLKNYAKHDCSSKHTKEYNHLCTICKVPLKILDTHLGSGSSRIAASNLGFDFWGYEIDEEYFQAQEKRFNIGADSTLFTNDGGIIKPINLFDGLC